MKRSSRRAKHGSVKPLTIALFILVATCSVLIFNKRNYNNSTYTNINYIKEFMPQPGVLRDYSNKTGMHNPEEDIKWFLEDDVVTIEFGRIIMEWPYETFITEQNANLLMEIGFTFEEEKQKNGSKILKVYYCGKEVVKHVK